MRIALVHELLTMRGGAEKLLKVVADLYPDAPIYTLLYDEKKLGDWFPKGRVRTSTVQKWATLSTNHHLYLKKFPKAVEAWDFSEYDLVISFSSAFSHGIITKGRTKHLCYVNSPARYLWDRTFDVLNSVCPVGVQHVALLQKLKRRFLERTFHKLRQWDVYAAQRPHKLLAASKAVRRRVELYWRRESDVLYPPVEVDDFPLYEGKREDYYIIASSLVRYKKIELAIEACNALQKKLKIAGSGPHLSALKKIAGPTIEFLGYVPQTDLVTLYQKARAFIFPGEEDFGIAPLEAMACGTPVIAYRKGGAIETIIEGQTGGFFDEPTSISLQEAMQKSEHKTYSPEVCSAQAAEFSRQKFEDNLKREINDFMLVQQPSLQSR